jgi:hypothetical protein
LVSDLTAGTVQGVLDVVAWLLIASGALMAFGQLYAMNRHGQDSRKIAYRSLRWQMFRISLLVIIGALYLVCTTLTERYVLVSAQLIILLWCASWLRKHKKATAGPER